MGRALYECVGVGVCNRREYAGQGVSVVERSMTVSFVLACASTSSEGRILSLRARGSLVSCLRLLIGATVLIPCDASVFCMSSRLSRSGMPKWS